LITGVEPIGGLREAVFGVRLAEERRELRFQVAELDPVLRRFGPASDVLIDAKSSVTTFV
jgi:hypothetical protein